MEILDKILNLESILIYLVVINHNKLVYINSCLNGKKSFDLKKNFTNRKLSLMDV